MKIRDKLFYLLLFICVLVMVYTRGYNHGRQEVLDELGPKINSLIQKVYK